MKKMISLLVIAVLMLPLLCVPVSATEVNAVEYIVNNVDALADVYAQLHPDSDEVFEGQSVEFMLPVTIVSTDSVGTYIDFDGENGYMVVQGNNEVIAWEVSGDLTYLKDLESTYFSIVDGFGYLDGGSFVLYETSTVDEGSLVAGEPYSGQTSAGDGLIHDYYAYMSDRYSDYQFYDSEYLNSPFDYVNQNEFSFYGIARAGQDPIPEGNCALSSIFALLNYLGTSMRCDFPGFNDRHRYSCTIDPFYDTYVESGEYEIHTSLILPDLYYTVRRYAINPFGYESWGLENVYVDDVTEMAAEHYSNDVDATVHILGSFDSHVVPEIDQDDPVIIAVSNSQTYGDHAMVVTGYRIYRKTTTILGIEFHDYVYLLRVNDNHVETAVFFDLTAYNRTCTYITVEVND